ncbi:hypothetical protein QWY14_16235 [Planococcus sp. N028]|uniref:YtxH domain-containing protein n=1 Tax=Planococcus shixiaomingii TaxID=3058393 RepID=A0ABT8N640_9BACL|nr:MULTISPECIES: hypothetical protein [unclassified Planococcus (in: firmicutes)]MDN7243355.1 hypothetical protein [Planococcus sp. N028]WKA55296.1 hypothetical protein QWY21_02605 [Planococcus sp. N022]
MAKRRGLLIAGLAAGAYAYFKNPENRRKATIAFNNTKLKVNDFMESQNLEGYDGTKTTASSTKPKSDGKTPSVQYVNEDKKPEGDASSGSSADQFGRTDSDTLDSKSPYSNS